MGLRRRLSSELNGNIQERKEIINLASVSRQKKKKSLRGCILSAIDIAGEFVLRNPRLGRISLVVVISIV